MKLSSRISTINGAEGADDGWSVLYRARDLEASGIAITNLSIGDHDSAAPDFVLDAMDSAARSGNTGYAPIPGAHALRELIAARVTAQSGVRTGADEVFVSTGGQGALFSALMGACDPGDKVVVIDPYYTTYLATVRAASCTPVIVPARPELGFQPVREDLMAAAQGAKALLINTPNNPTGAVYSRAALEAIRDVVRAHDLWLISDEVYATQSHGAEIIAPRSLPDMAERTIALNSFSKSHVMTGFRIGWLAGPRAFVAAMTDLTNTTTYGAPGFIQDAALVALRDGAQVEAETSALYTRRRNLALETLAGANALNISPPDGAMYVMLDIRPSGLSGHDFAHRLLDEHHIAVMPGESFGQAAAGHIRIALTTSDDALTAALLKISEFAQSLKEAA